MSRYALPWEKIVINDDGSRPHGGTYWRKQLREDGFTFYCYVQPDRTRTSAFRSCWDSVVYNKFGGGCSINHFDTEYAAKCHVDKTLLDYNFISINEKYLSML